MSEQEGNIEQVEQVVNQPEGPVGELGSLLNNSGGLMSAETRAELEKMYAEKAAQQNQATPAVENNNESTPAAETTPAENEATTPAEEPKKNVLGINIGKKKETQQIKVEKVEDIYGVMKSSFGQEIKDLNGLGKFLTETAPKWRADSQKLVEVQKEAETYKEALEGLPEDLLGAVKAYYNGQDYTKILSSKPAFDFKVDADKQDVKKLVAHYFPDKFSPEELELIGTEDQTPALAIAIEASKDKYSSNKKQYEEQIAAYDNQAKEQYKKFSTSVDGSLTVLRQSFPEVDKSAETEIKQVLSGGANKVLSLFMNNDGTWKPEAAKMLIFAQSGENLLAEAMAAASRETETRINEEMVMRGGEKKLSGGGGGTGSDISPETKAYLESLNKLKTKVSY